MRSLKFRVWNGYLTKEYKAYDRCYVKMHGAYLEINPYRYDNDYAIEQYTGLKDKNGKEIYEGDILASNFSTVYKVSYSEPNGRFEMWSEDGCGGSIADDQYTEDFEIEVIGNIHENPELLEQDNAKD